jgi:hypothetical protein
MKPGFHHLLVCWNPGFMTLAAARGRRRPA